jgi:DUF4097 and DUF4098 domain-containing protein YvlB
MRRRSITGPLMLLLIGGLFLWNNFHPEASVFEILGTYWPFLLILWGLLRLIEALWPHEGEWRGSFSGGEVALIVLVCLIGWGFYEGYRHGITWTARGIDMFGDAYDYPVSANAPAQGAKRIVFDDNIGNIKVIGGDGQNVEVTGHKSIRAYGRGDADRTNSNTPVVINTDGDRLVVHTNQERVPENQRISDDLEVTVPRGLSVEAHIRRGDFDISDIAGDADLAASRGDVRLSRLGGNARLEMGRSDLIRAIDVKGRMDIQGQGSDLSLENIGGQVTINGGYTGSVEFKNLAQPLQFEGARNTELHAQAVPGQITMDMGQFNGTGLTGPVRLVTRSRDIRIGDFTQSLNIDTERGDIQLQPKLPIPAIEARSGFGNIDLVVPDKASFQLNATAERGDAVNDYGPPLEREVDGRTVTLKGKTGEGPLVRLTATRGSVDVRKEGTPASMEPGEPAQPKAPKPPNIKNPKDTEIKL